jgi:hypothetical protein
VVVVVFVDDEPPPHEEVEGFDALELLPPPHEEVDGVDGVLDGLLVDPPPQDEVVAGLLVEPPPQDEVDGFETLELLVRDPPPHEEPPLDDREPPFCASATAGSIASKSARDRASNLLIRSLMLR